MSDPSSTISFTLKPGEAREISDAAVAALDDALSRAGSGPLMHLVDPRRIQIFSAGGPPVWSIAAVPMGDDTLFVTYGLSGAVDPARAGHGHELSIRIPSGADATTMWAPMLLRVLARYVLTSGRELKLGDYFPLPEPLSTFPFGEEDKPAQPPTTQDAVAFIVDPQVPTVEVPGGQPIEVRRVVGLYPDERELIETWSVAGVLGLMASRGKPGVTDLGRPSHATDPAFASAALEGSRREGSQYPYIAVPGVAWERTASGFTVRFPGGTLARRIGHMVEARLPFGKPLLVHDTDPEQPLAVALQPGDADLGVDGTVLILRLPPGHPYLASFAEAPAGTPLVWTIDVD